MAYLVLVRHGLSEWNKIGTWTGWKDPGLAPEGFDDAKRSAESIKDIKFDYAFTSDLLRAKQTLEEILKVLGQDVKEIEIPDFKERSYGIFEGKNKWQIKEELGEEEFQNIRRGWEYQPKNGESLKQVNERTWDYYQKEILPKLKADKNVLISGHGNTFRAFLKDLENLTIDQVVNLEFGIGEAYVYKIDENGKIISKEIRAANPNKGKI